MKRFRNTEISLHHLVIEPDSTRPRIIAALEMLASKRDSRPAKKHGNLPV